jgi:hypothetical protein
MKKTTATGDLRSQILKALCDKSMHVFDLLPALRLPPQSKAVNEVEHWLGVLKQQGYVAHTRRIDETTPPRWWITNAGRLHCRTE